MGTWFFHPGAIIVGWLAWLLGGVRVEGLEHVPRSGSFVLVSNHCSNMDPLLLGLSAGHRIGRVIHFMAKTELRGWPVIGWLAARSGVFFVRRGEGDRGAQRQALAHLAAGEPIALFPEGTRSRTGQLQAGRRGATLLALRSGAPLVPAGVSGTHRLFAGRVPRRSSMVVRIGPAFQLADAALTGRLDNETLTAGTERIMGEIAALVPVDQGGALQPGGRAHRDA
jgi:1-acyl-sn-glycerol-3-phosphate acyltransferase